ncbi:Zn(II)2Cys6 transcription factor [Aspergillus homomorphus CBS 101889]|uniref:Zn(2)-C6 fungal-type domain-containing protein n=1 Tax=Aspergillus homomorphus (strain CBS 101889) TaxID=1450537 RepID=A0A395IGY7_ASPHC|nr:hypothetical protein BO97DRAFT_333493 [Aspergillus homomorphus CBS 101889]RAL17474.1 hypothetical protein BO97DRAFT_333493 [Aspergillus homomorphus CBS 101889]
MEPNTLPLPRKKKQYQRSTTGCIMCRTRKKKCDEQHPICTGCQRNGLICEWPSAERPQRKPRRPQHHHLPQMGYALPPHIASMITVFAVPNADIVNRLLSHFTDYSPRWLSTRTESRRSEFLYHLIPAAMDSPLILKCILTVAAADLIKYDSSNVGLKGAAVEYYGQALASIREAGFMHHVTVTGWLIHDSDYTLLAVLLICLHEIQNFSNVERLLPHLNAAATLFSQRLDDTPPNSELRKLLSEMFCYFFALTTFTHGPYLAVHRGSSIVESFLTSSHDTGAIIGTAQQVFLIIFRASNLIQQAKKTGMPLNAAIKTKLTAMERQLHCLQNKTLPPFDTGYTDMEEQGDAIMSELYRLGCILYLKRTIDPSIDMKSDTVQAHVTDFIRLLKLLPPHHPVNCIFCWPLVAVGLCTTLHAHQRIITTRLKKIYGVWTSDLVTMSMELLRQMQSASTGSSSLHSQSRGQEMAAYGMHDLQFSMVLL